MKIAIVWYRNDLRVNDHPALSAAHVDFDAIVPVFILNEKLLHGAHASSNRNRFLLESLEDLKSSLKKRGADLVVRAGDPADELKKLADETNATAVYYTSDFSPYAIKRDAHVEQELKKASIEARGFSGRLIVSAIDKLHTQAGTTHKVFTPFWKNWMNIGRRNIATTPAKLNMPSGVRVGNLPKLDDITNDKELSPDVLKGGETAGRKRLHDFVGGDIERYHQGNNDMAADDTSRLSSYLHFGCISALEAETMLPDTAGARAWNRQLCWRDFYHYTLFHNPDNAVREYQERYRNLKWGEDKTQLDAWKEGRTGYPVVDAAMRQLRDEGWMHNRARLIVGSFLTKDLWLDWRLGETHFMNWLIDGDEANNNGNWQWIASVGVDPAPVFRRMYNPTSQGKRYDPTGEYIRRYVPELKSVPDKFLYEPWTMNDDEQKATKCIVGKDYPEPIVDHKQAREFALEQYRTAA